MENKKEITHKLKRLVIIFAVIIIPGLIRVIDSNAFTNVRNVDIALLFVSGVATGAFIVLLKIYLQFKKEKETQ